MQLQVLKRNIKREIRLSYIAMMHKIQPQKICGLFLVALRYETYQLHVFSIKKTEKHFQNLNHAS